MAVDGSLCLPDKKVLALFLSDPLSSSTCVAAAAAGIRGKQAQVISSFLFAPFPPPCANSHMPRPLAPTSTARTSSGTLVCLSFFMRRLCSYFVCICAGGHDHWQRRKKVFFPSYNSLHCVYSYPPLLQGTLESSISFASRDLGVKYVCIFCREIVRRTYVCTLYKKQLCIRKISLIFFC